MVKAVTRLAPPLWAAILLAFSGCTAADPLPETVSAGVPSPLNSKYFTPADRYITVEGVRYRVRDEGPRDAPVVMLIHGFSFSLESWDKWAAGLVPDYRVVRFDLAGHGLSSADPQGRYDANTRVRRILALMDRIEIGHAAIAGNSYGGLLAWHIAAAKPARVDKLVLVDSAAFSINGVTDKPAPVPPAMRAYLLDPQPAMVKGSASIVFADPAILSPERLETMRDMIARPGNGSALVAHLEQFTLPAPEAGLARVKAPTLILWGKADRVIPVEQATQLHEAIKGSQLIVYDGVGHAPQEEAAQRSLNDVKNFLSGHN